MSRQCRYPDQKQILIGSNTFKHNNFAFTKNGAIWEYKSIEAFRSFFPKKRFTLVDVGAQVGLYTLLATHTPNMFVHAFEPCPCARACLQENIELNGLKDRTKVYDVGLSDKQGIAKLNVSRKNQGLSTLGRPKRFKIENSDSVTIALSTIDSIFFANNLSVDAIKIDTEGWELYVLKGARETIQKWHPVIQIEDNEVNRQQCNVTRKDILDFMQEMGYIRANLTDEEEIWTVKE